MNVSTKKMEAGRYRVMVDGTPTKLVIEKGEAPKYRHEQEWCIGIEMAPGNVSYLSFDQRGLAGAVNTIRAIIGQAPGIRAPQTRIRWREPHSGRT